MICIRSHMNMHPPSSRDQVPGAAYFGSTAKDGTDGFSDADLVTEVEASGRIAPDRLLSDRKLRAEAAYAHGVILEEPESSARTLDPHRAPRLFSHNLTKPESPCPPNPSPSSSSS